MPAADDTDDTCMRLQESLIAMTIEAFRLHRMVDQMVVQLESGEAQRYRNKIDYFMHRIRQNLEDADMTLIDPAADAPYDPGMAVNVLNLDDFDVDEDHLVIDQVLEPIILNSQGIRRMGTVLLRRVE